MSSLFNCADARMRTFMSVWAGVFHLLKQFQIVIASYTCFIQKAPFMSKALGSNRLPVLFTCINFLLLNLLDICVQCVYGNSVNGARRFMQRHAPNTTCGRKLFYPRFSPHFSKRRVSTSPRTLRFPPVEWVEIICLLWVVQAFRPSQNDTMTSAFSDCRTNVRLVRWWNANRMKHIKNHLELIEPRSAIV